MDILVHIQIPYKVFYVYFMYILVARSTFEKAGVWMSRAIQKKKRG